MPFGQRVVLSNLWLTSRLVLRDGAERPEMSAMVRTTIAPTIVQGGVKDNVLPSTARAVINFRILPGESIASVVAHVEKVIADDRVTVTKLERTISEPAPFSSIERGGYEVITAAVKELFPDAVIVPGVMNGATDSRHFQGLTSDIYRFLPTVLSKADLPRFHGTDERASVANLATMVRAYRRIIQRGGAAGPP
jgi:carboxypeptidase PM20D1